MLRWLKQWRLDRRKEKKDSLFERGYNFAADALLCKRESPMSLEAMQDSDRNAFDAGMDAAIDYLIERKLVEDDRI